MRWAEYLFLFIGLIALDYYIWISLDSTFYQAYESWSFDRQVKGLPTSVPKFLAAELGLTSAEADRAGTADRTAAGEAGNAGDTLPGDTRTEPAAPASSQTAKSDQPRGGAGVSKNGEPLNLIGRILVPRLQLSAMVREGVGDETLRRAVGHIPSTALPGQVGNVALAGHRDTFFRKLRDIRKTDKIVVSTLNGNYDYEVQSLKIVTPRDVSVLRALPGEQVLTLVTCYPFNYVGSAPKAVYCPSRSRSTPQWKIPTCSRGSSQALKPAETALLGGQSDDVKPEMFDGSNDSHELLQIHRLSNIAVGVEIIGVGQVLLRVRSGQHHHRNAAEVRVVLHLFENLATTFSG